MSDAYLYLADGGIYRAAGDIVHYNLRLLISDRQAAIPAS
jgi:hypothetical protein